MQNSMNFRKSSQCVASTILHMRQHVLQAMLSDISMSKQPADNSQMNSESFPVVLLHEADKERAHTVMLTAASAVRTCRVTVQCRHLCMSL